MKFNQCTFITSVLVLIIGGMLLSASLRLQEGFASALSWKTGNGLSINGPYSKSFDTVPAGSFVNVEANPICCEGSSFSTRGGCLCLSNDQLNFYNQRGGNRTVDDGF